MLTPDELEALVAECRSIPLSSNVFESAGFVVALLETVLDYQMQTSTVERAMQHFLREHAEEITTRDELETCLARFPDTDEGNVALARYLWGYRMWTRAAQLRGLLAYFDDLGISTIEDLKVWANTSVYEDFVGRVKGLGPTIYQGLVLRLGVETVKPDVHLLRFVARAIGRSVDEMETVAALEEASRRMGVKANVLDWSIWEHQRGAT